jgi:hypothetical protein
MHRMVLICVAVVLMAVATVRPADACPMDSEARSAYPSWKCG